MAMMPLEMIPVGAKGENAAPLEAPTTRSVIRNAGMPTRVAIAMATGAMLAVGGVLLQTLTRNPMASPEVLGISSGAALAVANKIPAMPLCLAGIFYGAWWTGVVEGSLFIATPVSLCRLRALAVGGLVGLAPGGCAPHELKTINPLGGVDAVDALAYKHLAGGVSKGLARCALGQHFKRG